MILTVARRPFDAAFPPGVPGAVNQTNRYPNGKDAEASLLGVWSISVAMVQRAANKKAEWVTRATWAFVRAIAVLLLPLLVAIGQRL